MAHFQKDGLWVQGGQGALANVSEDTPFVPGQVGRVMSVRSTDGKVPRFYQYVKRYSTETAAAAAGQPAYWQDLDDFVVTADSATAIGTTANPLVAGCWLGTSPAAGKYGFVQVEGLATLVSTATVTAGNLLVPTGGTFFNAVNTITATESAALQVPKVGVVVVGTTATQTGSITAYLKPAVKVGW